ncbi:hypothetical protein PR202_gb09089 [Eleusine coracana subsp. coracana]|uniref:Nucleolar protein 10 n=1 Tax=Eleusine coracana subsp. coracana TaxID=191504 RepID=A0AAV5EE02_ELECO|nr:hypothetical protein PR202_gb09089 [Eleusine coracana subsp. coracana]
MDSAGRQAAARVREAARGRQVEFCCQADRWSTIARNLPGRTDNEIKNYWRTHFKKGKPSKNIERARARFLKQRREMQSQLLLQGQEQQQQQLKLQPDHHDAVVGEAAPAACPAQQHDDLQMMQDMDDLLPALPHVHVLLLLLPPPRRQRVGCQRGLTPARQSKMYLQYYINEKGDKKESPLGVPTQSAHPARFSPDDKYSRQRYLLKKRFGLLPTQKPAPKY